VIGQSVIACASTTGLCLYSFIHSLSHHITESVQLAAKQFPLRQTDTQTDGQTLIELLPAAEHLQQAGTSVVF